jgi:predicted ATPase
VPDTERSPCRHVVLTGGACSGKTTLLEELRRRGFATVPETAIQVIEELNAQLGVEGQKRWREGHWTEFQAAVAERQLENESSVEPALGGVVFLDRGWLDGIAYCRERGAELPEALREARPGRYAGVFLLDTLSRFDARGDTGRLDDSESSTRIRDLLQDVYREHGYKPVRVPEMPVGRRADFVVDRVLGLDDVL